MQWFFQAHDRMQWVGAASIVRQAGFAVIVFLLYRRGTPLVYMGFIECASVTAVAAFCIYVTRFKMGFAWPWPDMHVGRLLGHLRESAPIGLAELAWAFMWYFCTVLLGFIFADRTLGWFGASHRALMALHTFVWLYFFNLLPSISRCVAFPTKRLLELMDHSVRVTAWAGLYAAGILTLAAPLVLTIIYGPSFKAGAQSFSILAWMLPVAMLSGHHRYILIAYNYQKRLSICTGWSALASVVLGFALVPCLWRARSCFGAPDRQRVQFLCWSTSGCGNWCAGARTPATRGASMCPRRCGDLLSGDRQMEYLDGPGRRIRRVHGGIGMVRRT